MIRKGTKIYPNTAKDKFLNEPEPAVFSKKTKPVKKPKAKAT